MILTFKQINYPIRKISQTLPGSLLLANAKYFLHIFRPWSLGMLEYAFSLLFWANYSSSFSCFCSIYDDKVKKSSNNDVLQIDFGLDSSTNLGLQ